MQLKRIWTAFRLIFLSVAAGAFLIGIVAQAARQPVTSAEARQLIFSHDLHTMEVELECAACHAAESSTTGWDDLLPRHEQCSDCHDVEDDCAMCHRSDPELSPRIREYSPKFNHSSHIEAGKLSCAECHSDLDDPLPENLIGHFPDMTECMNCHSVKLVSNECSDCHLPTEDLLPVDHKLDWVNLHGLSASISQEECSQCHSVAEDCQACHNGDAVSSPHPRNYVSRHGHDAHLSDLECGVCHDQREFCNDCHRSFNVLPAGHYRPGWLTASGGDHSTEAKFDLESCMSCHEDPDRQPVCAHCHGE